MNESEQKNEGIRKSGDNRLVSTIRIIISSDKKNQWMLNQQVKICSEAGYFYSLKMFPS